ncbi:MAG: 50S ribosomal protein L11 methyltransferase [Candidatus Methylumidiphilus sp.]
MWRQLSAAAAEDQAEPLADRLFELGALSVSFEDEGDQPLFEPKPGETPIWRDTRVIALFEEDADLHAARAALAVEFPDATPGGWREETIQDQAWERAWLEHFQPMPFGRRLWIIPTGFAPPAQPDAVCVSLDPGLAFGTGTHPTTALCLQWLDGQDLQGKSIVDYGCGSGILGVAALLLGAAEVLACDIDPQALTATADNARKNGVEARLRGYLPQQMPKPQADILLANILANPLVELAERLAASVKPGGQIALSGILHEQAESVLAAYRPFFHMDEPEYREDWTRLTGVRHAA